MGTQRVRTRLAVKRRHEPTTYRVRTRLAAKTPRLVRITYRVRPRLEPLRWRVQRTTLRVQRNRATTQQHARITFRVRRSIAPRPHRRVRPAAFRVRPKLAATRTQWQGRVRRVRLSRVKIPQRVPALLVRLSLARKALHRV